MKTITFYSYKGGVGRTLALVNIAKRLSDFGKKVCLLEFDLEAPGLPIKFRTQLRGTKIEKGIVDYIYEYTENNIVPKSISDYVVPVNVNKRYQGEINLIPAGNTDSNTYWKKLSSIHWGDLFYNKSAEGVRFFLDMKEKIIEQINPDYLLIDSRTGFTETSAITMSVLADEVVIVAANNEENFTGVTQIWNSLSTPNKSLKGDKLKLHFVLSRIPFSKPEEKDKELNILWGIQNRFKRLSKQLKIGDIIVIHSNPELELNESIMIGVEKDSKEIPISFEYRKLFEKLTEKDFKTEEIEKFNRITEAEKLYKKAVETNNEIDRIEYLKKAIDFVPDNIEFLKERAVSYHRSKKYDLAINDFKRIVEIDPNYSEAYYLLAWSVHKLNRNKEALVFISKAIELSPLEIYILSKGVFYEKMEELDLALKEFERILTLNPQSSSAFNGLANIKRLQGKYDEALKFVYHSIELSAGFGIAYATLAEIKAALGQNEEFYINLENALRLDEKYQNIKADTFLKDSIYRKYLTEDRFKRLMEKYKIDIDPPMIEIELPEKDTTKD